MRTLKAIYASIPKVSGCRIGCSECCGPVPMLEIEANRVAHILPPIARPQGDMITPTKPNCLTCAYATSSGCSIYENRPFMCRLYGAVDGEPNLTCPFGAKADNPLAMKLSMEYFEAIR